MNKSQYWEVKIKQSAFNDQKNCCIYNASGRIIAEFIGMEYEDKIREIVSEHNYSFLLPDCDLLGFCPFDNKKDGFPCKDCKESRK